MVVHVNVRKHGWYDAMLILFLVHRLVSNEKRIKFEEDMNMDSFHPPNFDSVKTFLELAFLSLTKRNKSVSLSDATPNSLRVQPG